MMRAVPILPGLFFLAAAGVPTAEVEVGVENLRNLRGVVQICLTASARAFPDCAKDPRALTRTVPAGAAGSVRFEGVPPGEYALAVFHDENGNKKLDTFLGIPREGFAFSRNPVIRFGPPRFDQARFPVGAGIARMHVRMQYLL